MRGAPRRYDDDYHRKLRAKVARHRKRRAAEIAARAARRVLERGRKPPTRQKRWRLYERLQPRGETADVLLIRDGESVPSGYAAGGWLPSGLLPFHLARSLASSRRRQLREWLAGPR